MIAVAAAAGGLPVAPGAATAGLWVGAAVLALAGVAKLQRPVATGDALRLAGLPGRAGAARLLGGVEVVLAAVVLLAGGTVPAALLALTYLAFAAFAARQRRRPAGVCGCFGDADAPMTGLHVAVDLLLAGVATAAVFVDPPGVPDSLAATPLLVPPLALLLGTAAVLVRLLLTTVPRLIAVGAERPS